MVRVGGLADGERYCGKCGSTRTSEVPTRSRCPIGAPNCRSYFSVRTGTPIARSNVSLRKWAIAIYLCLTSLKSVSSMKLQRDIGVSQPTAWFMLHRIREAWAEDDDDQFDGPVEVDETYFGGERRNMSKAKRKAMNKSRGPVGKTAVVGVKDRDSNEVRAEVVRRTDGATLQGFVREHTESGATVYTDDAAAYRGIWNSSMRPSITSAVSEYVRGQAHTNGIESFWSRLKRAHDGTFHKMSPKHLQRYVAPNSPASTTSATQERLRRCGTRWPGLSGATFSTATPPTTGFRPAPGRRLRFRRSARASFSGVAPARSRAGSSIGLPRVMDLPQLL